MVNSGADSCSGAIRQVLQVICPQWFAFVLCIVGVGVGTVSMLCVLILLRRQLWLLQPVRPYVSWLESAFI